jgi:hypothetical protein
MNDLISGGVLLLFGLYLCFAGNIIQGKVFTPPGGLFVRADVYIRMLGVLVAVCASCILLRGINFKKSSKTEPFAFVVTRENGLTAAALGLFVFALPRIGFVVSTFTLTLFLVLLYGRKERQAAKKNLTRQEFIKTLVFGVIFSILLVIVVYLVFAKLLYVTLP